MKLIDLFSGIGGFHLGLKEAGFKFDYVGFSEINKYAKIIYKKHFNNAEDLGDVSRINPNEIVRKHGTIDILCGGFPCQPFSIAGKRKGFKDNRGNLFFEICRLCEKIQPEILFLENVPGLLSHEQGSTFEIILRELGQLGYSLEWQVLNSKYYGVPQNRERVFIIGYLRSESRQKIFPISKVSKSNFIIPTLTTRINSGGNGAYLRAITKKNIPQGYRVYDPSGIAVTLNSQGGGLGAKTGLYKINNHIRRLTPLECERAQGFPDNWTEGISDSQRYICIGNAVTVNVIKIIGENLIKKGQNDGKKTR